MKINFYKFIRVIKEMALQKCFNIDYFDFSFLIIKGRLVMVVHGALVLWKIVLFSGN